jgi:LPXTG-site transpeptidase (sortase) family protein
VDQPFFILGALVLASWWNRVSEASAFLDAANYQEAASYQSAAALRGAAALGGAVKSESELPSTQVDAGEDGVRTQALPVGQIQGEAQTGPQTSMRRGDARYPAFEAERVEEPDRTAPERLVIPVLGVDAKIVLKPFTGKTWDIRGLRTDVAWLEGTAHPGDEEGNTVLAGHIMVKNLGRGPFRFLDRLKPGARIVVYTEEKIYAYQVREQVVVKETEGEVTMDTGKAQLTLLTCTTWDPEKETYLRRRAVFADLVEVKPLLPEGG